MEAYFPGDNAKIKERVSRFVTAGPAKEVTCGGRVDDWERGEIFEAKELLLKNCNHLDFIEPDEGMTKAKKNQSSRKNCGL